jgi:hypothetical protein
VGSLLSEAPESSLLSPESDDDPALALPPVEPRVVSTALTSCDPGRKTT